MKSIGIISGMGPHAGIDMHRKLLERMNVKKDQEYFDIYVVEIPSKITDRTKFILEKNIENPAVGICKAMKKLNDIGSDIVVMPCNTAHSPIIYDEIIKDIQENNYKIEFFNIIENLAQNIKKNSKNIKKVALLATIGTYESKVYENYFEKAGISDIEIIYPDKDEKFKIYDAIYNENYGIKVIGSRAKNVPECCVSSVINSMKLKGADAIILGCTEIVLAIEGKNFGIEIIDPIDIAAIEIIKKIDEKKLKN